MCVRHQGSLPVVIQSAAGAAESTQCRTWTEHRRCFPTPCYCPDSYRPIKRELEAGLVAPRQAPHQKISNEPDPRCNSD